MQISLRSRTKLRELINEETKYRSGPKLISFFNELGFNDEYGQDFPSRWKYTDDKLDSINGTSKLKKCIEMLLNPVNFVEKSDEHQKHIESLNNFLYFDDWKVLLKGKKVIINKIEDSSSDDTTTSISNASLSNVLKDIPLEEIKLDPDFIKFLKYRLDEIWIAYGSKAYLAVVILSGALLEGLLLGIANKNPKVFNSSNMAPKYRDGKRKKFSEWKLRELIDVANDVNYLGLDVKSNSHALREFRNYIHPMEQMKSEFKPDKHTATICLQVLKAAVCQVEKADR